MSHLGVVHITGSNSRVLAWDGQHVQCPAGAAEVRRQAGSQAGAQRQWTL